MDIHARDGAGVDPHRDDVGLIDINQVRNALRFAKRSVRRHWLLGVSLFVLTMGLTAAVLKVWPKTYHVEATLLARRNDLMTSLSNPGRAARPEADDPTRAASEMIHQRENLLALIQRTDLVREWERTRSPIGRLKDRLLAKLHAPTQEDRLNAVLWTLDHQLFVNVEKEGVVRIGIDWPDPHLASALVQAAVDNFISARHETEAAAITEAITILQGSAASLQHDVDGTIAQLRQQQAQRPVPSPLQRMVSARPVPAPVTAPAPVAPPAAPVAAPDSATVVQLGRLQAALDAKQLEIRKIETARRQQISDLQGRLSTALTIYTEDHPTVSSLRQSLAAASADPPELMALRGEAQLLDKEYETLEALMMQQRSVPTTDSSALAAVMQLPAPTHVQRPSVAADPDAPMVAILPADVPRLTDLVHPASRLLTLQLAQLANLLDRINSARLELATSGAGLKFRYTVTRPPEVPKAPTKPKVLVILLAVAVASLLLALACPVALDLLSGRVFEPWQIESGIGIPVLGRVEFAAHE